LVDLVFLRLSQQHFTVSGLLSVIERVRELPSLEPSEHDFSLSVDHGSSEPKGGLFAVFECRPHGIEGKFLLSHESCLEDLRCKNIAQL